MGGVGKEMKEREESGRKGERKGDGAGREREEEGERKG